ncbi:MAG: hypothetical protein KDJ22_18095, partial [Candidatus Competibacteraceae bacterium]|nr:hypothetical protein [Candidatus Competibacteraceae bacterium]
LFGRAYGDRPPISICCSAPTTALSRLGLIFVKRETAATFRVGTYPIRTHFGTCCHRQPAASASAR